MEKDSKGDGDAEVNGYDLFNEEVIAIPAADETALEPEEAEPEAEEPGDDEDNGT